MSFSLYETGLETYDESIKLVFPHPPVILERYKEQKIASSIGRSLSGSAALVQWDNAQHPFWWDLQVRRLTAADMAILSQLRNAVGLLRLKVDAGITTTYLVGMAPEDDQKPKAMVADHPNTKPDGSAIDSIYLIYEIEMKLVRMV